MAKNANGSDDAHCRYQTVGLNTFCCFDSSKRVVRVVWPFQTFYSSPHFVLTGSYAHTTCGNRTWQTLFCFSCLSRSTTENHRVMNRTCAKRTNTAKGNVLDFQNNKKCSNQLFGNDSGPRRSHLHFVPFMIGSIGSILYSKYRLIEETRSFKGASAAVV